MTLKTLFQKAIRKTKKLFTYDQTNKRFLKLNKKNRTKKCIVCGEEFETFAPYRIQPDELGAIRYFDITGSDTKNFSCYYCQSTDRDRHLFMYFDKLSLWESFQDATVLHFAPEKAIENKILKLSPANYIKGDLYPREDWVKVDITDIQFESESFNIVICNHVLEHVPDYLKAIDEIHRVLKPGGFAILQTPVSELLYKHFEDESINSDELRASFYGQEDHIRIVSKRNLLDDLGKKFKLNTIKHSDFFDDHDAFVYGVNPKEDLFMVIK